MALSSGGGFPINGPLVSIVVTYYSYAEYLAEALASIGGQTYTNLEVILVDDGSPVAPAVELIPEDFSLPIRILAHEKNLGLPSARNTGVSHANGDYLVILDSDDVLEPDFLAETLSAVERMGADGAYTQVRLCGAYDHLWIPDVNLISVLAGVPGPTSFLMKRGVFEIAGGYKPHLHLNSDHEFWLSALAAGCRFVAVDEPLYKYRKHPGSMSATTREDWWQSIPVLLSEHRALYEKHMDEVLVYKERQFRTLEREYDRLYEEWTEVHSESNRVHFIHEEAMQRIAFADEVFKNPLLRLIFFAFRRLTGKHPIRMQTGGAERPQSGVASSIGGDQRRAMIP